MLINTLVLRNYSHCEMFDEYGALSISSVSMLYADLNNVPIIINMKGDGFVIIEQLSIQRRRILQHNVQ